MADKIDVAKIVKLIELGHELHQKSAEVLAEIDALIGGKAGIGAEMKLAGAAFGAAWAHRYAPGVERAYIWNQKVDNPNLKRLVKKLGAEEIGRRAWTYIRNEAPFYVSRRHPFGLFVSSINSHAREATPVHRPVGCKHDPPCESDSIHTTLRTREMRGEVGIF